MLTTFQPQGNTSLIAATTTASAAVQPSTAAIQGCRVANIGSVTCFVAFGVSTATATLPTTSTPAAGTPLLSNSAETFTVPPSFWISAITTGGTASLYVTPGFGV